MSDNKGKEGSVDENKKKEEYKAKLAEKRKQARQKAEAESQEAEKKKLEAKRYVSECLCRAVIVFELLCCHNFDDRILLLY